MFKRRAFLAGTLSAVTVGVRKTQSEVDPVSWTPICLSFGVHDVKEATIQEQAPPLCAGVPSADGRAGTGWSISFSNSNAFLHRYGRRPVFAATVAANRSAIITLACRRTRPPANSGNFSNWPPAKAISIAMFSPSTKPASLSP